MIFDQKSPTPQVDYINLPATIGERRPVTQKQTKKKIPENLVLTNKTLDIELGSPPPCSGPYIPISECFSGNPRYFNAPKTPLNNLDPPTNRSHNNIGFNLSNLSNQFNDQSYSPKITNSSSTIANDSRSRSGRNSPTDSESVFTDDELSVSNPRVPDISTERHPRPSDSSIENDAVVFTCSQRFSRLPGTKSDNYENVGAQGVAGNIGTWINRFRRDKKERLVLDNIPDPNNDSSKVSFLIFRLF